METEEKNFELSKSIHEFINNYTYYGLVFGLSLIIMIVAPMFGSVAGFKFNLPNTIEGWIVFVITKFSVACLNVLIFHCFIRQAKKNVRNDPKFIEAQEIMGQIGNKLTKPRSPHQYFKAIYTKKSTTVFLTSILSTVAITDILTKYDWKLAVTYGTTIITCIIFSILKMKDVEIYWTEEYYAYAKEQQEGLQKAQEQEEYKNITNNEKTPPEASTGLSGAFQEV